MNAVNDTDHENEAEMAETEKTDSPSLPDENPPMLEADWNNPLLPGVVEMLRTVFDPEIPVDVYLLGLIYRIDIKPDGQAKILMTLTAPACPVAGEMPIWVKEAAELADGITGAEVELVWDPPWTPDMMTEAARLDLGFF